MLNKKEAKNNKKPKKEMECHPALGAKRTFGQKASDNLTRWVGSWTFILFSIFIIIVWITLNTVWLLFGSSWDPKPFIMLNLFLSILAALQAPVIMMSQNRQGEIDRIRSEYDYAVNRKSERKIEQIQTQLGRIERNIRKKK